MVNPDRDPWEVEPDPLRWEIASRLPDGSLVLATLARCIQISNMPGLDGTVQLYYVWRPRGDMERIFAQADAMLGAGNQAAASAKVIMDLVTEWDVRDQHGDPVSRRDFEAMAQLPDSFRDAVATAIRQDYETLRGIFEGATWPWVRGSGETETPRL